MYETVEHQIGDAPVYDEPGQNHPEPVEYHDDVPDDPLPEKPAPLTQQQLRAMTKAEKRRRRRATVKYRTLHASRERWVYCSLWDTVL